jgi:hypothetical protein
MRFARASSSLALLSLVFCVSCSRQAPSAPPPLRVEAEVVVRSTNPEARCELSGSLHVPRQKAQPVTGGTWRGSATGLQAGDVVAIEASIFGTNTWACEAECSLRQVGTTFGSTSRTPPLERQPAPSCAAERTFHKACIFDVQP